MDAIAHAATRRLDSSLHAVGTPTPAIPVESARTLSVTADYRLSEVGRKASLLNGGNGRAEQRVKVSVPLTRLHLVHVDANGIARLKLRPQFKTERRPAHHQDQARAGLRPPANHRRTVPGCRAQSRARARVSRAADDHAGHQARDARRMAESGGAGVPRRSESAGRRLSASVEAPLPGHDRSRSGAFRRQA